jgi:hypothetical protein
MEFNMLLVMHYTFIRYSLVVWCCMYWNFFVNKGIILTLNII